jgi:hypothetical protein
MIKGKYDLLKEVVPAIYKINLRYSAGKVNFDIVGRRGNKLKPMTTSMSKTSFFTLSNGNNFYKYSKYEILCFLAGIDVINRDITLEYIQEEQNQKKIQKLIIRELGRELCG